jgi:hypothetical protein
MNVKKCILDKLLTKSRSGSMKTIIPDDSTNQTKLHVWNTLNLSIGSSLKINILASKSKCMDQLIRKAIEMKLHPKIKQKDSFYLSRYW